MIQGTISNQTYTYFNRSIRWYADISDKLVSTPEFMAYDYFGTIFYLLKFPFLLYKLESQQTGKTKIFTNEGAYPSITGSRFNINTFERYMWMGFQYSANPNSVEDLSANEVLVGNQEFPLGFYNITVYETDTNGELNPANAKATLINDVLHMKALDSTIVGSTSDFVEVRYDDYTANDTETDNVYITY